MSILIPGQVSNTREETQIEVLDAVQKAATRHVFDASVDISLASEWDFSGVDSSSVITIETNNNQRILALTVDPLVPGVSSWMEKTGTLVSPAVSEAQVSLNQRTRTESGVYAIADTTVLAAEPETYTVTSISQAAAVVSIVLSTPFAYGLGTCINITNVTDNRICYQDCPVFLISEDRLTIQVNTTSSIAIPSTTIAVITTGGTVTVCSDLMRRASDGCAINFLSTTNTSAEILVRRAGTTRFATAVTSIAGDRRSTTASTNLSRQVSGAGLALQANSEFRIEVEPGAVSVSDRSADSVSGFSMRTTLESTAPSSSRPLKKLIGLVRPPAACSPLANIVSVTRSANSAVITLDRPATSFTTGNYIQVYGVFNKTLFPDSVFSAAISNVLGNTVTVPWTGTDGTSYGGFVTKPAGQVSMSGTQNSIISVSVNAAGQVILTSASTWTCTAPDLVRVQGVRANLTGDDLGIDGVWKINRIGSVTTTLVLDPVFDYIGVRRSPVVNTMSATDCGGGLMVATTIRVHSWKAYSRAIQEVRVYGQGVQSLAHSIPTYVSGGGISATQGTAAAGTGGTLGWPVAPGLMQIVDIASAAITTTTTGSAVSIAGTSGGATAFQLVYQVTAASGTNPTLDVRIEVTDDGVNYYPLYDLPRITAAGVYRTPELRSDARTYRLVQTISGTSPSFTRVVTRNSLPFQQPEPRCQIFDRTVVLTTASSTTQILYCDGPSDIQLYISIGAATTPPALQLQVSEDNGSTWVSIGSPLTAVANSTVRTVVTAEYARHVRAIVTTPGSAVTANYVLIKAVGG